MSTSPSEKARIRVSLTTGELEIEGTEAFVSQYAESIDAVLERLRADGVVAPAGAAAPSSASSTGGSLPPVPVDVEPFGEVLHSLSSKSGTDQILLAGYYVGNSVADGTFSTNEAHARLIEQGVKLSNASQSMKNNLSSKRVFKVGTRFKIAKTGVDHLKSLGVSAT
jgi:hypothetical protein